MMYQVVRLSYQQIQAVAMAAVAALTASAPETAMSFNLSEEDGVLQLVANTTRSSSGGATGKVVYNSLREAGKPRAGDPVFRNMTEDAERKQALVDALVRDGFIDSLREAGIHVSTKEIIEIRKLVGSAYDRAKADYGGVKCHVIGKDHYRVGDLELAYKQEVRLQHPVLFPPESWHRATLIDKNLGDEFESLYFHLGKDGGGPGIIVAIPDLRSGRVKIKLGDGQL